MKNFHLKFIRFKYIHLDIFSILQNGKKLGRKNQDDYNTVNYSIMFWQLSSAFNFTIGKWLLLDTVFIDF